MRRINAFILRHIRTLEMTGVLMRIGSFSVVSWLGSASPFFIVWGVNTVDALLLSWCAILKNDRAYTLLNIFWVFVGIIGMMRASNLIP